MVECVLMGRASGDPVTVIGIPVPVGISTATIFADECGISAAAIPPFPAYYGKMITACRPITQVAEGDISLIAVTLAVQRIFITQITGCHN